MTTAFADYVATQDARNTLHLNIRKWCLMLIDALKGNYCQYSISGHKHYVEKGENAQYHIACIEKLRKGDCPIDYEIETGRKYHKIIFIDGGGSRSVHCFVDRSTGEVYKSASWKSPAKDVRYDLRLITDREWLYEHADWAGGYLYKK
jgi:hypothetical protein